MTNRDLRADARKLQRAALAAVEPAAAVRRHVHREESTLVVAGQRYGLDDYEHVFVIGGGKAAAPMSAAITDILDDRLTKGALVTKYGYSDGGPPPGSNVRILEAGHPMPDENSVCGAQIVVALAQQATEHDLVICLISGGGSALLTLPAPGLTLAHLRALTDALLRSGATINEMNTVRKHWSRLKGGNLARLIAPATSITLILSDVVGDPLDVIASGPTTPDTTSMKDALNVLERYGIEVPENGTAIFQETPKPGDSIFEQGQHVIIGSNHAAAAAAVEEANRLGFNTLLLSTHIEGEAREAAKIAAALAKSARSQGYPAPPPACLVWGGETTVTVRGPGKGGRNQELALAAALALEGWSGILMMALATDGTDGPTDAGGAFVTGETAARARALGLDPRAALAANDSYPFFDALDDLIHTGPTGTNVNDLLFILVG